ncbi:MAG: M16 family metallopeptidase, partial [Planctomycetota bacterium]
MPLLETIPEFRTLAPGVEFLALPDARFKRVLLKIAFDSPLDGRSPARTLLLPVLEQGSAPHPSRRRLTCALEELFGAVLHLGGDRVAELHRISVHLEWVGERFLPADAGVAEGLLDLAREILEQPLRGEAGQPFPPGTLEREREQLIRQIRSRADDRDRYAQEQFLRTMCAGEPYGRPPYGTEEEVARLDGGTLETVRRDLLGTCPVTVIAVGPFSPARMEAALREWFDPRPGRPAAARREPPRPQAVQPAELRTVREQLPVDQARFLFGFRFPPPTVAGDMEAHSLASGVLGGGPHSLLFREVRERSSLAYGIGSSLRMLKGILVVSAGIDEDSFGKVQGEVLHQIERLRSARVSMEEIEPARLVLLDHLESAGDSGRRLANFHLRERLLGTRRSPAQRAAALQALGPEDLARAADLWKP